MGTKLFFGGLAWATTEAGLKAACEAYGPVTEVRIITDHATGRSRGFGFVTFETEEAAERAKGELDGTILDGRTIKVDFPRERSGGGGGSRDRGGYGRDRRY